MDKFSISALWLSQALTPFKNLNRGRVSNIIGKTVPIFSRPETEGTLRRGGSTLREVKLIVLSSAIRVSFWAFYKLST